MNLVGFEEIRLGKWTREIEFDGNYKGRKEHS